MSENTIVEIPSTSRAARRTRSLVLINQHGRIEEFASIADACKAHSELHAGHISEILNGSRNRCRGFSAMALDVHSTLNSDAGLSEKFFRAVKPDGTRAAQHGSEADERRGQDGSLESPPNAIGCGVEARLVT